MRDGLSLCLFLDPVDLPFDLPTSWVVCGCLLEVWIDVVFEVVPGLSSVVFFGCLAPFACLD